ncbi:hypothetical protein [Faecalispora jeddahensis]|uniref:hypothetical protein n=1 Tax=Faecalispora jeddahensis TaxID=1414721 RepID=UPI001A9B3C4A|nr:hypothetical protein [Faecalispora jeddahensis]
MIDNAFHSTPRKNICQSSFFAFQKENKIHTAIALAVTLASGVKLWKGKPQHFQMQGIFSNCRFPIVSGLYSLYNENKTNEK